MEFERWKSFSATNARSTRSKARLHQTKLDTPTIAPALPMHFRRRPSFSATNTSRREAKLAYVSPNSQTPCPPRGAVPVNPRTWFRESVSPQHARFAFGYGCDHSGYVECFLPGIRFSVNPGPTQAFGSRLGIQHTGYPYPALSSPTSGTDCRPQVLPADASETSTQTKKQMLTLGCRLQGLKSFCLANDGWLIIKGQFFEFEFSCSQMTGNPVRIGDGLRHCNGLRAPTRPLAGKPPGRREQG